MNYEVYNATRDEFIPFETLTAVHDYVRYHQRDDIDVNAYDAAGRIQWTGVPKITVMVEIV